jgi:HK97 family phage major capsid protein
MADKLTIEQMLQDISQRMQALGQAPDESQIRGWIQEAIAGLANDEEFQRKMRFGANGNANRKLVGTKYARFGLSIADVEFLYDLQESLRGQRKVSGGVYEGASEELRNTFRAISEAIYLPENQVREMDRRALDNLFPRIPLAWFQGNDRTLAARGEFELTEAYQRAIRAMDTAESGYGQQLIGASYVGELWEGARRESRVFGLIDQFEMLDPTVYLPVEVDIPEMLFVSESTANNSSAYGTTKTGSQRVQVDAKKFVIHQMWSGEMEEDSIIPFIPFLRRQAQLALNHYMDSLVVNGDTTNENTGNINLDDDNPADTKHYLAFDGLRHVGLVDNTGNSKDAAGAITYAEMYAQKGRMVDAARFVDWGHPTDPTDLVYVADIETADQIAQLDEVVGQKQQRSRALLNGEVADILGHPVIGSMAVPKTEADGKVSKTAANNTKGQLIAFNRRGFKAGWRRRVKLETERLPATDQTRLVYSLRTGLGRFTPTGAASGIECADVIYDIEL